MKNVSKHPGDLIKIPFESDTHTYARILREGSYAIYDCPVKNDIDDFDKIIKSDILFIVQVNDFAIENGYWKIIKNIPLENELVDFYPLYFNPVPMNDYNINFYRMYREEIENAISKDWIRTNRLQLDGINDYVHVVERIEDYYNRKRNDHNAMMVAVFKKYLGFPTDVE